MFSLKQNMITFLLVIVATSEAVTRQFNITSEIFGWGDFIPVRYTCEGKDFSPPLFWENQGTQIKSYAIIMDDPDAGLEPYVHWVVFNLPPSVTRLAEHEDISRIGGMVGRNSAGINAYKGPCPPSGVHRYMFKVYALDDVLKLDSATTAAQLKKAMENHILASGELMGRYQKKY